MGTVVVMANKWWIRVRQASTWRLGSGTDCGYIKHWTRAGLLQERQTHYTPTPWPGILYSSKICKKKKYYKVAAFTFNDFNMVDILLTSFVNFSPGVLFQQEFYLSWPLVGCFPSLCGSTDFEQSQLGLGWVTWRSGHVTQLYITPFVSAERWFRVSGILKNLTTV